MTHEARLEDVGSGLVPCVLSRVGGGTGLSQKPLEIELSDWPLPFM
jgi:hypothetical protein